MQAIEAACGLPVVTSNQATIWASLRELGLTRAENSRPFSCLLSRACLGKR
eukprot:COSAG06_NODE_16224_length_1012_cov_3.730559_1_plen_50_part_10